MAKVADLAASERSSEEYERAVELLVGDTGLARRVIDWLPEAFGLILVSHMNLKITLPKTFQARDRAGTWVEIPFSKEPIFCQALKLGVSMLHQGHARHFEPWRFAAQS